MSKTKILFIISIALLIIAVIFTSVPALAEAAVFIGGGCGFFFLVTSVAAVISFATSRHTTKTEQSKIEENKLKSPSNTKKCQYCGSENKIDEVKCTNCGANLKTSK